MCRQQRSLSLERLCRLEHLVQLVEEKHPRLFRCCSTHLLATFHKGIWDNQSEFIIRTINDQVARVLSGRLAKMMQYGHNARKVIPFR